MSSPHPNLHFCILRISPSSPPPQALLAALTALLNTSYAINHAGYWTAVRIPDTSLLLSGYPFPHDTPQERLVLVYYLPAVLGSGEGIVVRDKNDNVHEIGKVVATATICSGDNEEGASKSWHVGMLGVDVGSQKMGLARQIMSDVEGYAELSGGEKQVMVVIEAVREVGNEALYLKLGYEKVWEKGMAKGTFGSDKEFTLVQLQKVVVERPWEGGKGILSNKY